jgi:hypothetical protein
VVDTPTLLIGLGGTGGLIAYEVWKKVPEQSRNFVGLHIFDTDRNPDTGLGKKQYAPLWDNGMITQTSPPMMVKECFQAHQQSTQVSRWFPFGDAIGQQPMTDGASQVRSVSRLALLDTLAHGRMDGLNRAIEELLVVRPQQGISAFRVLVVDTLAGGTGSGMFLQVAMYVRYYLEAMRGRTNVVIRNVSLLPGLFVQTGSFNDRPQQQQNVLANGYAAIKELDGLIVARNESTSSEAKRFVFPMEMEFLPNSKDAALVGSGPSPYETVFLVDHINSNGQSMNTAGNYVQQAIDAIHLQLLSPLQGKLNGQANNNVRAIDNTQGRGRYASMGTATLRFPYEDIVRYLALRWAAYGLDDQWLVIDRQWRKEVEEATRKREFNASAEIPLRKQRYVEIIDHLASGDTPQLFFRDIRRSVQLIRKDKHGVEIATEKVSTWLTAVRGRINSVIENVGQLALTRSLDSGSLRRPATFIDEVRSSLAEIDRLHRRAISIVESTASDVANDVLWADASNEPHVLVDNESREKAGYRLNIWMLAPSSSENGAIDGLHPVAVRYFLYRAYADIIKLVDASENQVKELRQDLTSLRQKYDDPNTPVIETAEDRALELAQDLKWYNRKKKLEDFAIRYESDVKSSVNLISSWASKAIESEVLRKLKGTLEGMIADWESFFDALGNKLQQGLCAEIENEERRHISANPMDLPVLASPDDKRRFWKLVSVNFAHEGVSPEICARLYIAQYLRAVARRNQSHKTESSLQDAMGLEERLYRDNVIAWCERRLKERDELKLDIVTAIRKEWEIGSGKGNSSNDWLLARIQGAKSIAAPWLPLRSGSKAERMTFWGLPSPVSERVSSQEFQQLFEMDGDNPVVDPEFSPFEIKRFAVVFAVSIADIPNFRTGSGNYWRAYQDLRGQTLASTDRGLTTHIDKRWDSPAYLREMDDGEQDAALARLRLATLYAVFHKEIEPWQKDGRLCWRYYEGDQARDLTASPGVPYDPTFAGLYQGLATHYRLVADICLLAQLRENEARRKAKTMADLPLIKGASTLLDALIEQSLEGGAQEGLQKDVLNDLTGSLADEVLACALRLFGSERPNTAIHAAESALKVIQKGCAPLRQKNLQESASNIKQSLASRPQQWRKRLELNEKARATTLSTVADPLVFLG